MTSAKEIAAVKVAVEVCNRPMLRREILCAPGSEYDTIQDHDWCGNLRKWDRIVTKHASVILIGLGLPTSLRRAVTDLIFPIGMGMLTWAVRHEHAFDLSREYIWQFLNSSFFTQRGIIDSKRAAEELIKDKNLSIKQRYMVACICCFTEHIPVLYGQLTKAEKDTFYALNDQSRLVLFWTLYMMDKVDELAIEESPDQLRLDIALEDGSKAAFEYFLEKANVSNEDGFIVGAALQTLIYRRSRSSSYRAANCIREYSEEQILFRNSHTHVDELYTPSFYYMDILCFLLSRMTVSQSIEFLQKDMEDGDPVSFRVLEYLLYWPYQDYFMRTVNLMWEFLPEQNYADVLWKISYNIETDNCAAGNYLYGESRSYNYRRLLREFWEKSPEHYKRFVLSDKKINCKNGHIVQFNEGAYLLFKLFGLNNFTNEDRENISVILADATIPEKENIIFSEDGNRMCNGLVKSERWETLDKFISDCIYDKEEAHQFKRQFACTEDARDLCIDFVKNGKWDAAESFIKWSALPEEEVVKLKNEIIYSKHGKDACVHLVSCHKTVKALDKFIRWCFATEEKVTTFKKELIFSDTGISACASLIKRHPLELAIEFVNFCLFSDEEVREFKKNVAYREGSSVCEGLISDYSKECVCDGQCDAICKTIKFCGGEWEEVETFLTWCFESEEEISSFKKNVLFEMSGEKIHFALILCNKWEEAKIFFAWLELTSEEIKQLKTKTLLDYDDGYEMFCELMYSKEGDANFIDYGSKQEAIELFLRWFLTDKETVLEFKDAFKSSFEGEMTEKHKDMLENFDLMIEQRLRDLDDEKRGIK